MAKKLIQYWDYKYHCKWLVLKSPTSNWYSVIWTQKNLSRMGYWNFNWQFVWRWKLFLGSSSFQSRTNWRWNFNTSSIWRSKSIIIIRSCWFRERKYVFKICCRCASNYRRYDAKIKHLELITKDEWKDSNKCYNRRCCL